MFTRLTKPCVCFIGQNSHGSDESWRFRKKFIKKYQSGEKCIVLVECPTIDLLVFSLKRGVNPDSNNLSYLKSSLYWWMRTGEFVDFLSKIPPFCEIVGIDLPNTTKNHSILINKLDSINILEKEVLIDLLKLDLNRTLSLRTSTPEQRELAMAEKISSVISHGYKNILVVCHNFHASRHSWLDYPSLCQQIIQRFDGKAHIISYGVFSENMEFIATPDGHSLTRNLVKNACIRCVKDNSYNVKMISSFYRTEELDALRLKISVTKHFNKIIVYPTGQCIY